MKFPNLTIAIAAAALSAFVTPAVAEVKVGTLRCDVSGGLGLIVGLLGRVAAFGIACTMVVAVFKANIANGLFMNWEGTQKGEGYEYHLLAIAMGIAIMIMGSGALSLDRLLTKRSTA